LSIHVYFLNGLFDFNFFYLAIGLVVKRIEINIHTRDG